MAVSPTAGCLGDRAALRAVEGREAHEHCRKKRPCFRRWKRTDRRCNECLRRWKHTDRRCTDRRKTMPEEMEQAVKMDALGDGNTRKSGEHECFRRWKHTGKAVKMNALEGGNTRKGGGNEEAFRFAPFPRRRTTSAVTSGRSRVSWQPTMKACSAMSALVTTSTCIGISICSR